VLERCSDNVVTFDKVHTTNQVADIFTKPLDSLWIASGHCSRSLDGLGVRAVSSYICRSRVELVDDWNIKNIKLSVHRAMFLMFFDGFYVFFNDDFLAKVTRKRHME